MTIQEIRDEVSAQRTVIDSARALLASLHQKLDEAIASNDPAALASLSADLKANTDALSSAVVENTPATPTPTPTP